LTLSEVLLLSAAVLYTVDLAILACLVCCTYGFIFACQPWRVMRFHSNLDRAALLFCAAATLTISGCGDMPGTSGPVALATMDGFVHGGQQPITGAKIYLYAAGTTGYGSGATSLLLGGNVISDAAGAFTITGQYTCPTAATQVYVIASGGNTGSGVNSKAVLLSALGNCGDLTTSTFINVSEVSSVAGVYALAQFMTPGTVMVGSSSTNVTGLKNAFATVNNLVNNSSGDARSVTPAGNGIVSQATINTLANIMAACINSTGGVGACPALFTAATPAGGSTPTDTLSAMINIALNPARNVTALFNLPPAKATFQPALTAAPNDFTLSIQYSGGGLNAGQLLAVDGTGNVWVPNASDPGTISEFSPTGAALSGANGFAGGGLSYPESLAVDTTGYIWSANEGNATISKHTPGGVALSGSGYSVPGMLYPYAIAIDGTGNIFTANGNNSVSKLNSAGSSMGLFVGGGMDVPYSLAVDGSSNIWVANGDSQSQANSVSKFSNTGTALTTTPYSGGGLATPVGIAVDAGGNVWAANFDKPAISKLNSAGVALSGTGYVTPNETSALAIDGSNTVWTANVDGSVSRFANSGTAISPSTGYISAGATAAVGIAIDASGNVWTTDYYVNSLFEYIGAASPAVVPLALAVQNQSFGARP
jgi:hypothetical protein